MKYLWIIIGIIVVGGVVVFFTTRGPGEEPVYCTQDAKLCPDGSYVGRVGPNCEFTSCPGE